MLVLRFSRHHSTADHHGATPQRPGRRRRRAVLAAGAAAGLLLYSAAAATAHVRVIPETTTAGGFAALTFRVPTESDTAGTVKLRVELPAYAPFTSVRTKPIPGWTSVVERGPLPKPVQRDGATITEAPTAVVWTAERGTQVAPGQFEEFAISVGPLPEAGTQVVLPATQTYSDGKVVAWDQVPAADGSEPELPAPTLVTTESTADGPAQASSTSAAAQAQPVADTDASSTEAAPAEDTSARWLGGAGLVLGAAALITVLLRRRPRAPHEAG